MTFLMVKNAVFKLIRKISLSMVIIFQLDRDKKISISLKKRKNRRKIIPNLIGKYIFIYYYYIFLYIIIIIIFIYILWKTGIRKFSLLCFKRENATIAFSSSLSRYAYLFKIEFDQFVLTVSHIIYSIALIITATNCKSRDKVWEKEQRTEDK